MRALIVTFDHLLSRAYGVYEFCDDPDCIVRLQMARAPHTLHFPDHQVLKGEPVLGLHLWNKRPPPRPPAGPGLGYPVSTPFRSVAVRR